MLISFFFESNTCVLICLSFVFMRRISPHFWSCEGCTAATGKCKRKVNQFYTEKFVQNISLIIKSIYNLHTLLFFSPCFLSDNGFNECAGIGSANYQFSKNDKVQKVTHDTGVSRVLQRNIISNVSQSLLDIWYFLLCWYYLLKYLMTWVIVMRGDHWSPDLATLRHRPCSVCTCRCQHHQSPGDTRGDNTGSGCALWWRSRIQTRSTSITCLMRLITRPPVTGVTALTVLTTPGTRWPSTTAPWAPGGPSPAPRWLSRSTSVRTVRRERQRTKQRQQRVKL